MSNLYLFGLLLVIGGCAPAKTPVEQLTFEQKAEITKACETNGKVMTDDYCKEVTIVYTTELYAKADAKAHEIQRNYKSNVKMPY